ncbi:hypothetical protein HK098_003367 [Nowakowskiella sp. JEL0407]|nr:hypothetical protein HK098_003367 [Nowakowskiella sp. JEL0407]
MSREQFHLPGQFHQLSSYSSESSIPTTLSSARLELGVQLDNLTNEEYAEYQYLYSRYRQEQQQQQLQSDNFHKVNQFEDEYFDQPNSELLQQLNHLSIDARGKTNTPRSAAIGFLRQRGNMRSVENTNTYHGPNSTISLQTQIPLLQQQQQQQLAYNQLLQRTLIQEQLEQVRQQQQLILLLQRRQQLHNQQLLEQMQQQPLSPQFSPLSPSMPHLAPPVFSPSLANTITPASPVAKEIRRQALNEVAIAIEARKGGGEKLGFQSPITQRNVSTGWHAGQSETSTEGSEYLSLLDEEEFNDDIRLNTEEMNYSGLRSLERISAVLLRKEEELRMAANSESVREEAKEPDSTNETNDENDTKEVEGTDTRKQAIKFLAARRGLPLAKDSTISSPIAIKSKIGGPETPSFSPSNLTLDLSKSTLNGSAMAFSPPTEILSPLHSLSSSPTSYRKGNSFGSPQDPSRVQMLNKENSHIRTSSVSSIHSINSRTPIPVSGLLHRSPAFQVLTSSTVKDRHLFLFPNYLIIAKEILPGAKIPELFNTTYPESLFYPKSVFPISLLSLKAEKPYNSIFENPRPHPIVTNAITQFQTNPISAIAYLISKRVLQCTPESIAVFLHITPTLDRRQLGVFLGISQNAEILSSFLSLMQFRGIPIIKSLRIFLGTVRLPGDTAIIQSILLVFAEKWYEANYDLCQFTKEWAVKLVFDMITLNAKIHSHRGGLDGTVFLHGGEGMDRQLLSVVYNEILDCKLSMVKNVPADPIPIYVTMEATLGNASPSFPTRITVNTPSPLIAIKIPKQDPDLIIFISGKEIQVSPNCEISFAKSSVARFRIRAGKVGKTFLMISKMGRNADRYAFVLDTGEVEKETEKESVMFESEEVEKDVTKDWVMSTVWTRSIIVEKPFLKYTFQLELASSNSGNSAIQNELAAELTESEGNESHKIVRMTTNSSTTKASATVIDTSTELEDPLLTLDRKKTKKKAGKYVFSVSDNSSLREWMKWFGRILGKDRMIKLCAEADIPYEEENGAKIFNQLIETAEEDRRRCKESFVSVDSDDAVKDSVVPLSVDKIVEVVSMF